MKSHFHRIFAAIFASAIAVGAVSCGEAAPTVTTSDSPASDSSAPAENDALLPSDKKNFNNSDFTIITSSWLKYVYAEEQTGSLVNDAMYERDLKTAEALGVNIKYHNVGDDIKAVYPAVQSSVMSGDKEYDLVVAHVNMNLVSYVSDNLVCDWNTIPHVDLSKPYWNKNVCESLSINGKSPFAASDIFMEDTVFLLYNKKLAQDMSLGSLYDYVYDGTWTWDKLGSLSSQITGDVDGNNVMDEYDRYGVAIRVAGSSWLLRNIPASNGQFVYQNGKDGIELTVNSEKTQKILERAVSLFNGGGGYLIDGNDQNADVEVACFNRGTYLTYFVSSLRAASAYNNLDFDYGVLPLPKYDENQDGYISLSWSHNLMIPSNADRDMSGMVSEWMSYYGHTLVRPKFYDSLLSVRFAQDSETVDMLNLIFDNIVCDPAMNFTSKAFYGYFDSMVKDKKADFASYYQKNESTELAYIEQLNESFSGFAG